MGSITQLAYRTPEGIGIIEGPPSYEPLPTLEGSKGSIRCSVYSPDGRYFAWSQNESVVVIETHSCKAIAILPIQHVFEIDFSPKSTFIITWQRPWKDEKGDAAKNLLVWRLDGQEATGISRQSTDAIGRFVQKSATGWNLKFTSDEQYCARTVSNEVHLYMSSDLFRVWKKLRVEGVSDISISPGQNPLIAVFCPECKGLPAAVKVFKIPEFSGPISQKNFFKGDKAHLKWNSDGTSLLVLAQTEVDRSGKSYYGETTLYLLSVSRSFDSRIDLDKDGPIHDVSWSPNAREFGVVYGYMPAKAVLFNADAKTSYVFPTCPRNTMLFSPHGRFLLIAGFGNLAGQVDIYDLEKSYNKVCTIEASNASVCHWSSDEMHILTATTSPRLRVDNGIKIWHVSGILMYTEEMRELYNVEWRPQSHNQYPLLNPFESKPAQHLSALTYLGSVKTPPKPAGAYRPPGARGQMTPLAFRREDEGGKVYVTDGSTSYGSHASGFSRPRRREIPGAEVDQAKDSAARKVEDVEILSKAATKNKKKREAKKNKETAESKVTHSPSKTDHEAKASTRTDDGAGQNNNSIAPQSFNLVISNELSPPKPKKSELNRRGGNANEPPADNACLVASNTRKGTVETQTVHGVSPHDKRIRALLKKLRAIDDLKMRRASGDQLEATQIKKLETEEATRRELIDLGYNE